MILAKFYQKILQKYKILVSQAQRIKKKKKKKPLSPALNLRLKYSPNCMIPVAKMQSFPAFEGAHPPSDTPLQFQIAKLKCFIAKH